MITAMGHVDYYPNGGSEQPSLIPDCQIYSDLMTGCDHWASIFYYLTSLKKGIHFYSKGCNSWEKFNSDECDRNNTGDMGFNSPNTPGRGKQYLRTIAKYPYVPEFS